MDRPMKLGFNAFDPHVLGGAPKYTLPLGCGADLVLCHTDPLPVNGLAGENKAARLASVLADAGVEFIANFEFQNVRGAVDAAGHDWTRAPDGCHRLTPDPAFIGALGSRGNLLGVTYDEFEYAISTRNLSLWWGNKLRFGAPVFPPLKTKDPLAQAAELDRALAAYVREIKAAGAPAFAGEHVFPILYHTFARAGMIPNYKAMKESCSNLQFAVAAGAALQYGAPLWSCADLWFRQTFPGHTPEELYQNLVFAYLAGADLAYVESAPALVKNGRLTAHGEAYARFARAYRGRPRAYHAADYRPGIGIIRFDDTWWGQNAFWDRGLYGNGRLRPNAADREWLTAVDTVTFGESGKASFNLNRIDGTLLRGHRAFCSMNGLAVFDAYVRKETLASLRLVFLCGRYVSDATRADVEELVREQGLTAVVPPRFLPERLRGGLRGGFAELPDGAGTWLAAGRFDDARLKKRLASFLGRKNEIRLPFAQGTVALRLSPAGELLDAGPDAE